MTLVEELQSASAPADDPTKLGLLRKMLEIMRECGYVQKDKRNEFHKYNYASESAIKEKLHESLVKHGVLFQCDCVSFEERLISKVNDKGRETVDALAKCQFHYSFTDVDTGEQREGTFFGTGVDSADKHLYKAVTGAIKYILTTTFLIATGDDPESEPKLSKAEAKKLQQEVADKKLAEMGAKGAVVRDVTATGPALITDGQRKRLYAMSNEAKLTKGQVKLILASRGFDSSTKVTVDKYDGICNDITRCGLRIEELPQPSASFPGYHVRLDGNIYRLSDSETWENLGDGGLGQ